LRRHIGLDLLNFLADLLDSSIRDLLAGDSALGLNPEKYLSASMIEHRAERMHRIPAFARCFLKLQQSRFALGYQTLQLKYIHRTFPTQRQDCPVAELTERWDRPTIASPIIIANGFSQVHNALIILGITDRERITVAFITERMPGKVSPGKETSSL